MLYSPSVTLIVVVESTPLTMTGAEMTSSASPTPNTSAKVKASGASLPPPLLALVSQFGGCQFPGCAGGCQAMSVRRAGDRDGAVARACCGTRNARLGAGRVLVGAVIARGRHVAGCVGREHCEHAAQAHAALVFDHGVTHGDTQRV